MPPAIYAPLIAKDLIKDEAAIEQLIRDLIEVANRLDKPVLATGNVHYINPEDAIYREIIVRALGQGAMINRPIGKGENAKPAPLPEAHFRTTNEMLDDFAFLGKDLAYEIVVTNTQAMADQIEEVEVVKKDLYTPFIDRAEEQVAEMTYARAFELYGNPLPVVTVMGDAVHSKRQSFVGVSDYQLGSVYGENRSGTVLLVLGKFMFFHNHICGINRLSVLVLITAVLIRPPKTWTSVVKSDRKACQSWQ